MSDHKVIEDKIEELGTTKKAGNLLIILAAILCLSVNECTYHIRVSNFEACMKDEADDIFVNYANCGQNGEPPKP